jgi:hypothetical protein
MGDRILPDLDRAPGAPEEVPGAAQDVVARGHAGQGARVVRRELQRARGEAVDVRGCEFARTPGAQHVAVEAVEQEDDDVRGLGHGPSCTCSRHKKTGAVPVRGIDAGGSIGLVALRDDLQAVGGNAAVTARRRLEADLLTFSEALDARALQRRDVHEHILAAAIGCDKAETLGGVEKFYHASRHSQSIPSQN